MFWFLNGSSLCLLAWGLLPDAERGHWGFLHWFLGAAPLVGLRRALGASRQTIFNQHLVEVGVIGIAGGVIGIGLAALGLMGVRQLYENYDTLTRLDVTMALTALVIAIASGVLAGLYPTWRVCRVQPAAYLKTQ